MNSKIMTAQSAVTETAKPLISIIMNYAQLRFYGITALY